MLKKQRQDIVGVEVSMVAERADDLPKVFTSVKLVYTVRGRKLNKALVERAVSLSTRSTARPLPCSRNRPKSPTRSCWSRPKALKSLG